ncbi:MAG: hypothetical protein Q8L34_00370 [Candidatus Woesearchaeota archaeon]|nr:hypothetical protein [Candidatus Woesearchaeota archaeon]
MLPFDEIYIENNFRGAVAEKVFELVHRELKIFTFRTGQENLFPNLIDFSNAMRKKHHRYYSDYDVDQYIYQFKTPPDTLNKEELEEFNRIYINNPNADRVDKSLREFAENEVTRLRFQKTTLGLKISSSPDFTVLTPAGKILQFEVKYRANGELSEEQQKKYLTFHPDTFIFLVSSKEPHIRILIAKAPKKEIEEYMVEFSKISKNAFTEFFDKSKSNVSGKEALEKLEIQAVEVGMRAAFEKLKEREPKARYEEVPFGEDGSIIISLGLKSERLIYPGEVLSKYSKIIRTFFK